MHVTYYWIEPGKYIARNWAEQCPEKVMMMRPCQGVAGHDGDHWCYGEDGSYHWHHNDREGALGRLDVACGMTPPGHAEWISPVTMSDRYYLNGDHDEWEITDPEDVARLDRGELLDGESLQRPCFDPEEWEREITDPE